VPCGPRRPGVGRLGWVDGLLALHGPRPAAVR
jgi:hypothetical protein